MTLSFNYGTNEEQLRYGNLVRVQVDPDPQHWQRLEWQGASMTTLFSVDQLMIKIVQSLPFFQAKMTEPELQLDPAIRTWVFLPIFMINFLIGTVGTCAHLEGIQFR